MKIWPRSIVVNNDELVTFKIKNSSKDDQLLLYKIRRSEPKLVSFRPKNGIVEPGMTQHITAKLLSPAISHARILVKVGSLKRSNFVNRDFNYNWASCDKVGRIAKKVVDIRNSSFLNFAGDDSVSGYGDEDSNLLDASLTSPHSAFFSSSSSPNRSLSKHTETSTAGDDAVADSPSSKTSRPNLDILVEFSSLKPLYLNNTPSQDPRDSQSTRISRATNVEATSTVVEVWGHDWTDTEVKHALESRIIESLDRKLDVISLEVRNASINSLARSVCAAFTGSAPDARSSAGRSSPVTAQTRNQSNLDRMRSMVLEASLRHISIHKTSLTVLDASVNRFTKLSTLDLSNNAIERITEGALCLPHLQRLDLSGNRLTTLDLLEQLISLRCLNASANLIESLQNSIYKLVPLAASLISIDLSDNQLESDPHYVYETVSMFPKLQYFDGRDLEVLEQEYNQKQSRTDQLSEANVTTPRLPEEKAQARRVASYRMLSGEEEDAKLDDADRFDRHLRRSLKQLRRRRFFAQQVSSRVSETSSRSIRKASPVRAARPSSGRPQPEDRPGNIIVSSYSHDEPHRRRQSGRGGNQNLLPPKSSEDPFVPEKGRRHPVTPHFETFPHSERRAVPLRSSIVAPTVSLLLRQKTRGIVGASVGEIPSDFAFTKTSERGWVSDSEAMGRSTGGGFLSTRTARSRLRSRARDDETMRQMQEEVRYGKYHPRYRIPKPVFGFSKPFAHRDDPNTSMTLTQWKTLISPQRLGLPIVEGQTEQQVVSEISEKTGRIPGLVQVVSRMRDSFEKMPPRGTFPLSDRSFPAEWYGMDYEDLQAIRRQGYHSENVGVLPTDSRKNWTVLAYQHRRTSPVKSSATLAREGDDFGLRVTPAGTILISPTGLGRREISAGHLSQYAYSDDTVANRRERDAIYPRPKDLYSDHRKWHEAVYEAAGGEVDEKGTGSSFRITVADKSIGGSSPGSRPTAGLGHSMSGVVSVASDAMGASREIGRAEAMVTAASLGMSFASKIQIAHVDTTGAENDDEIGPEYEYVRNLMAQAQERARANSPYSVNRAQDRLLSRSRSHQPDSSSPTYTNAVSKRTTENTTLSTPPTKSPIPRIDDASSFYRDRTIDSASRVTEIVKRIEGRVSQEEEELATYLSWLNSQAKGGEESGYLSDIGSDMNILAEKPQPTIAYSNPGDVRRSESQDYRYRPYLDADIDSLQPHQQQPLSSSPTSHHISRGVGVRNTNWVNAPPANVLSSPPSAASQPHRLNRIQSHERLTVSAPSSPTSFSSRSSDLG